MPLTLQVNQTEENLCEMSEGSNKKKIKFRKKISFKSEKKESLSNFLQYFISTLFRIKSCLKLGS